VESHTGIGGPLMTLGGFGGAGGTAEAARDSNNLPGATRGLQEASWGHKGPQGSQGSTRCQEEPRGADGAAGERLEVWGPGGLRGPQGAARAAGDCAGPRLPEVLGKASGSHGGASGGRGWP
jgi:hypothetical protein